MIERDFDVPLIADLALREKQIQQNYRPVIAVHKWFARRPGTLFRGLLLAEFGTGALRDTFYRSNQLGHIVVADPFMGGGTPLLEANRLGCDVVGFDINPMAWWVVREEIEEIDLGAYRRAAEKLRQNLETEVGSLYRTTCVVDGAQVDVKYFLWVKVHRCTSCGADFDLFPGYLLAEDVRHPMNVVVCASCGDLNEVKDRHRPGRCAHCRKPLDVAGNVRHGRGSCPHCRADQPVPDASQGPYRHRLFAIEYHNPACRRPHQGRFFKKPDRQDLERVSEAERRWARLRSRFVPDDAIPAGDETDRLLRWGCKTYRDLFSSRQLLGLEFICRLVATQEDPRIRRALATNLSDLLRYQNMLCRYDTMALKSLDVFSVHGFPIGFVHAESNLLGIRGSGTSTVVGSGGWLNITDKYGKAKAYCEQPFEIRHLGAAKVVVPIPGEHIGLARSHERGAATQRRIALHCENAESCKLGDATLDAVFTDPPYFGNVQYAELMDFCYVWLRKLSGEEHAAFKGASTRNENELTGNANMGRGLEQFATGLSRIFRRMGKALKPGAPLAFTFHHNLIDAYHAVAVAVLDSGLACTASIPCPAEMGASIHINGTGSSIVDTVLVCRSTGTVPRRSICDSPKSVAELVRRDLDLLVRGHVNPTKGDIRCIAAGHLSRLAIWFNRKTWDRTLPARERLSRVAAWIATLGGMDAVTRALESDYAGAAHRQRHQACEPEGTYAQVSF